MEVSCSGKAPAPPFLLVGNHLSYLDIVGLLSVLPAVFVAKSEVRGWPLLGGIAADFGTIFIKRDSLRDADRVRRELDQRLASGEGLVVFPEGTSSPGEEVLPFRAALLEAARAQQRPVHWMALLYDNPASRRTPAEALCWWGGMGFASHLLGVLREPPFRLRIHFGGSCAPDADRGRLAKELHAGVSQGLAQLKDETHEQHRAPGRRK